MCSREDKMPAPDLNEMVEASTGFCPFCPGHIDTATPEKEAV